MATILRTRRRGRARRGSAAADWAAGGADSGEAGEGLAEERVESSGAGGAVCSSWRVFIIT